MSKPNICVIAQDPFAQGETLVDAELAFKLRSLQFVVTAWGGPWSATIQLDTNQINSEDWIIGGLGRQISIYNDAGQRIWKGFVSEVSGNIGGLSVSYGPLLDVVKNKVLVVYSTFDYTVIPPAAGVRDRTAYAQDAQSQSIYGIIELIKSAGGCAAGEPEQIRDVTLAESAYPKPKERDNINSSNGSTSVTLNCLGDVHWLKAYVFNDTGTTGTVNASTKIQSILAADPNGIIGTDYTGLSSNTTQVGGYENDDAEAFSLIKGITSLGDSSDNRWIFYLDANNKPFYHAIPTTPLYKRQLADPSQFIRFLTGGAVVFNWNVEAGQWIYYPDLIPQYNTNTQNYDPRQLFIEQMTFSLPYNVTLEGGRTDRLDQVLARLGLAGGVT